MLGWRVPTPPHTPQDLAPPVVVISLVRWGGAWLGPQPSFLLLYFPLPCLAPSMGHPGVSLPTRTPSQPSPSRTVVGSHREHGSRKFWAVRSGSPSGHYSLRIGRALLKGASRATPALWWMDVSPLNPPTKSGQVPAHPPSLRACAVLFNLCLTIIYQMVASTNEERE